VYIYVSKCLKALGFTSVVDKKLLVPDPDPTFQRVSDPDSTLRKFWIRFWIRPLSFTLPPELKNSVADPDPVGSDLFGRIWIQFPALINDHISTFLLCVNVRKL
jgi:hypothetical protein